ncbi:DUF1801 domain-containing protein [Marinirhabdus gelatinilytica]|uniref:Uncharacterized protein DUF1801 n=1 Tax=Marinirhabdus gelatinilytica TaxID=1703343 RepID=A0A370Q4G5_9FLAO|nr:DUF1801 domain-containing protein [Marinirhabdus gelatinilytica]RDK83253.1 uncharacterized protein DUF1801 [Marinirhabdus gelatinilytica]
MNPAETYILKQPEPFKTMLLEAQVLVEQTLPEADLKYKWSLPMYFVEKAPICYFNITKGYFDLCFWVRDSWELHLDTLVTENRKFVKSLRYTHPDQMDAQLIVECVDEAYRTRKPGFTA